MKYSSKQISKAGEIITTSSDLIAVAEAVSKVNEWREQHLPVIELVMNQIQSLFSKNGINLVFSSYRLKRMTSIQYKLDLNPDMRLGGMQDIAGGRFVFSDVTVMRSAYSLLIQEPLNQLEIVKTDDHVDEKPKTSGYRSVHIVYKYHSFNNEDWDGMKVEIQLRTKLQHSWAMAVETAGLVTNTAMKSGQGSDEWQEFFQIISCLFAMKEGTILIPSFCHETKVNLLKRLKKINDKNNFFDQLLALKLSVSAVEKRGYQGDIFLLYIDFNSKKLRIVPFAKDKKDEANELYNRIETRINDKDNAAVLVSVSKYKELREAYPSYFLDMEDFNKHIRKYLTIGRAQSKR